MKRLTTLLFVFTAACSSTPLSPTRAVSKSVTGYVRFDAFNAEHVCNTRDTDETHTLGVWNVNDGVNQIQIKFSEPTLVAANTCADITMFLTEPDCVTEQVDDYRNMPKQDNYTMSFAANYFYAGYEHTRKTKCSTTTTTIPVLPPPPPPPPPHQCSAASFVSWSHAPRAQVEATGVETETIVVATGQGPVVWYLSSWSAQGTFEFGVPLPQTRIHMTVQTLHDGVNYVQVQIATPEESLIWQVEGGCEPGPPILTSAQDRDHGGQFNWLDDDGGDLSKRIIVSVFRSERMRTGR